MRVLGVNGVRSSGIEELDSLLGGLPSNYSVLMEGSPGSGKTSLALSLAYANAVKYGSRVLYISTNEGRERIYMVSNSIGLNLREVEGEGLFVLAEYPTMSDAAVIDEVTAEIARRIAEGFDIVIIDSVTPLIRVLSTYAERRAWLHTVLYKLCSKQGALLVLIADRVGSSDEDISLLEYLVDVVMKFEFKPSEIFPRTLSIVKFRGRPVPPKPILFTLTEKGPKIILPVSEAEAKRFRTGRKALVIEDEVMQKLLGRELRPGTQVSIIVREPAPSLGNLLEYLVLKSVKEAVTKNMVIGHVVFGINIEWVPHELMRAAEKILKNRIKFIPIDVTSPHATTLIGRALFSTKDFDLLFVAGYEKLTEFYGLNNVSKLISICHQVNSKYGTTTFRVYRVSKEYPKPPSPMLTMSDIVLEVWRERGSKKLIIGLVKGVHTREPIEVTSSELARAIEKLRSSIKRIAGDVS